MTTSTMQRKTKGVTVSFSVRFFLFLCMVMKEFKILPWARRAFCVCGQEQLEPVRALSSIPAGAFIYLLRDLPTKPAHDKIQFISTNISGLRPVRSIFKFSLLIFLPPFENYRLTSIFFKKYCGLTTFFPCDDILN